MRSASRAGSVGQGRHRSRPTRWWSDGIGGTVTIEGANLGVLPPCSMTSFRIGGSWARTCTRSSRWGSGVPRSR